jgi:hypothetical protein
MRKIESTFIAAVRFFIVPPQRPFVDRLPVFEHQRKDAGDAVLIDVFLQHCIESLETLRRDDLDVGDGWF